MCCGSIGRNQVRCNYSANIALSASPCFIAITKIFTHSKMGQSEEDEFLVERTLDNCTKNSIRSHIKKALGACYLGQRSRAHNSRVPRINCPSLVSSAAFCAEIPPSALLINLLCVVFTQRDALLLWKKMVWRTASALPLGRLISWLATSRARPLGASAAAPVLSGRRETFAGQNGPMGSRYICIQAKFMPMRRLLPNLCI